MKYSHLLFDADDTLFDFPKASSRAFSIMCEAHGISNSPEIYQLYHEINLELWAAFDQGEVTKEFVTLERYVRFFKALDIDEDPAQCNRDYLAALGQVVYPLPHAEAVCRTLAERGHRLYIVTNAVASVQRSRLRNCAFGDLFTGAFISEEAGASKPSRAYYDYVRACVPAITSENTLVIGDSLATDIRGANNAGFPCCWFNPGGKPRQEGLRIDYEVTDLRELLDIV
ncbi:YjjG family noncanonical pyrimidine nucleotidase [uncultured Dysosmobacter sp.]|uniref:YjjG family noncanonical pyrimidine nucleotidase n=1 Tax=uncultured Dysosmobacter sp. TaxID=2591384 RepID=UPI002616D32D|nr:YjjG family noncanonical pyrimidine nucleotidase [uncultured Dysosmobacter sp.]